MSRFRLPSLICLFSLTAAAFSQTLTVTSKADAAPHPPKALHSFNVSAIDRSADPCTNFYQYACGNWRKDNPIPADETSWVSFAILQRRNQYLLWKELNTAATDPKTALQRQYGGYYAACTDKPATDALGAKPAQASLAAIDALHDKAGIAGLIGDTRYDVAGFAGLQAEPDQKNSSVWIAAVYQGGLTLPDRDYYLENDAHMQEVRRQYHDYIVKLMQLDGESSAAAKTTADDVLRVETALAKASMPRDAMRDPDKIYHVMPVSDLYAMTPAFDWKAMFAAMHVPAFTKVNVAQPAFFKAMNTLIVSEPLSALKNYMRFQTLNGVATQLSSPFDEAHFDFFGRTLSGQAQQEARWRRCTADTDNALGEAVGQDWVKENFPPAAKVSMEKLVDNLKTSLHDDIAGLPWMSAATKQQAELKLSEFRQKIGYPDKWRDYSGIVVKRDDWYGDAHRAGIFNNAWYLNHIGKPVDESEWGMTPPTVNAYYEGSTNDINFPAGILQPPFYQLGIDPAVNYGAIGSVIGHEMTHGFDDEGSRFDGHGNKRDWFTAADQKQFDQRTQCVAKEYDGFQPLPGQHLNGQLTLGENTADNGGIRISYQALQRVLAAEPDDERTKKIDGYTPDQRFFIAFAQVWCENTKPAMEQELIKVDPHSPGQFRTDGVVQNFAAFGQAFGCHTGQPMMPTNTCHVW